MKNFLICLFCFSLYACDDVKNDNKVVETAQIEQQKVINNIENKITPEQRKRNFENKMFDLCQYRFEKDYGVHYPLQYRNNVCICFAEKITASVSASEQEIEKYNSSELYQRKKQEQIFGECAEKNKKYKSFF